MASADRPSVPMTDLEYAIELHHLNTAQHRNVLIEDGKVKEAIEKADSLIEGIVNRDFPPRPAASRCRGCDARGVCKHANKREGSGKCAKARARFRLVSLSGCEVASSSLQPICRRTGTCP